MAKKKVINTSKTAHVMNLISKNYKEADGADQAAAQAESQEAAAQTTGGAAPVPTAPQAIVPSLPSDLEITSQIKDALEDLLEDEPALSQEEMEQAENASAPISEPEPPETLSAPEPVSAKPEEAALFTEQEIPPQPETEAAAIPDAQQPAVQEVQQETQTAAASMPASQPPAAVLEAEDSAVPPAAPAGQPQSEPAPPVQAEQPPAPAAQPVPAAEPPAPDTSYINIMQALVEDSAGRYIKMFGLCDCPKCVADVKAIALNNLVPKYIVAPENERNPRVIIYNERYHAEVTAQILRACKIVMDNPLHEQ
ncbi:MAG: hypothetical protein HFE86_03215 [Clostridiales bacterium]|nr:hypothetical protein [Clostridiales bacterium]